VAEAAAQAAAKGTLKADAGDRFDSNCITPGTPFMVRLQEHLQHFVNTKITTDPMWKSIKVVLDGHECPGEGEHKIMDFIRSEKNREGYDPNTRHCMYGLDADLMMLGLLSHEPHFCLLREEVKFGGASSKVESSAEEKTWHLLSLKLFREYLDFEFGSTLRHTLPFEYDLERLIDDWILLGYLVGNDFMPHLPNFHIGEDIKPFIYESYKKVLATMDGWITDAGELNMARLEVLMLELSKFDVEHFSSSYSDLQWMGGADEKSKDPEELAAEKAELFEAEMRAQKSAYYREKMHVEDPDDPMFLRGQAETYVTGLQWCLWYYYKGTPSWGWFYPSHYSPFVSDVRGIADFEVKLARGKPFLPFQQLMSVLPNGSRQHVPPGLQPLMTQEDSPIYDFYPREFEIDLNGKKQDWEALVLIPFINESRLIPAMEAREPFLTKEEKARNIHSKAIWYEFDLGSEKLYPYAGIGFPSFRSTVSSREMDFPHTPFEALPKQLIEGVDLTSHLEGFPSFSHLDAQGKVMKANINIFGRPSRSESIIVKLKKPPVITLADAAKFLQQSVWVRVPHMVEAMVIAVSTDRECVVAKGEKCSPPTGSQWTRTAAALKEELMSKQGIDIGETSHLLHVRIRDGKTLQFGGGGVVTTNKRWAARDTVFPIQTVKLDLAIYKRDVDMLEGTMTDWFPVGSPVCYLGHPNYGSLGKVVKVDPKTDKIMVTLDTVGHPVLPQSARASPTFMSIGDASKRCGIQGIVLGRLIANVFVFKGSRAEPGKAKQDVGLKWKFNKSQTMIAGITELRADGKWTMSGKAVEILKEYRAKFGNLLDGLGRESREFDFYQDDLFPHGGGDVVMEEVRKWLKTLSTFGGPYVAAGSRTLNDNCFKLVEVAQDSFSKEATEMSMQVKPGLLQVFGQPKLPNAADAEVGHDMNLGDRVICVHESEKAPLYAYGTVVSLHGTEPTSGVSVIFDGPVLGGNSLDDRCTQGRGVCVSARWLLNISGAHRAKKMPLSAAKPLAGGAVAVAMASIGGGAAAPKAPIPAKASTTEQKSLSDMFKLASMTALSTVATPASSPAPAPAPAPAAPSAAVDAGAALLAMLKAGAGLAPPVPAATKARAPSPSTLPPPVAALPAAAPKAAALAAKTAKYIGVVAVGPSFTARIKIDGGYKQLGTFKTREEAARAYDAEARTMKGRDLNFPAEAPAATEPTEAGLLAGLLNGLAMKAGAPPARASPRASPVTVPTGKPSPTMGRATVMGATRTPTLPAPGKGFAARRTATPPTVPASVAAAAAEDLDEYADMWRSLMVPQ
jgi:5'-3' exoribonuclease 1